MLKRLIPLLLPLLLWSGWAGADDLVIGRMRVAVWPEYDDPGALVTYDGRFADPTAFPTKTHFYLPKNVVVSDACSLSPDGQHFCQIFKIEEGDETWNEIELWLPFPNFYLSFHLPQLDLSSDRRRLDYRFLSNHTIQILELDIQQPLRSSDFRITPTGGKSSVQKDFNHFAYRLENIEADDEQVFEITYVKADHKPSVDIKYSSMSGPKVWGSPYETQKKVGVFIYLLVGSGVVVLLGILWYLLRKKRPAPS